jgi:transposase-like protein
MSAERRVFKRYSIAFRQKVVSEIENGTFSISHAQMVYDITGATTIQTWLKKFGKNHLLNKVVRIEMKDETSKIKELKKQKQELESALAQAQLKIICLESTIEAAEEMGYPIKKKSDIKALPKHSGEPETNKSK